MYIAVCDDQVSEIVPIVSLLNTWQTERHSNLRYKTYRSAAELLDDVKKEQFTLYLLDIMMPGTDGLMAAREIRDFDDTADIIFLTASPYFAYESYGVRALDYLLKPLKAETLFPILDRLLQLEQKPQDGLTIKSGSTLIRILFSQLSYVEVNGKHIYFNMTDGVVYEVTGTLKEYSQELLARPEFIQIHRSYIVNMFQISELSPSGILTFTGKNLPVSRLLYNQIQKEYMKLLFNERDNF